MTDGRAAARRRRPGQGPDLHARRASRRATLARLRFPLGELTKPQVRALAAEAGLPVASKAESQDLCFLAGTGKAAFLARHGGAAASAPATIVDRDGPRARPPPRPPPLHGRPAQGARRRGARAALRARHGRGDQPRHRRPARGARHARGRASAARACTAPAREVDAVKLRYRSRAVAVPRGGRPGPRHARRLELELDDPVDGAAPGQTACLLRGDVVVGWGTIAAR